MIGIIIGLGVLTLLVFASFNEKVWLTISHLIPKKKSVPNRLQLADVKPQQFFYLEHELAIEKVIKVLCISNDPSTKKIWAQINWEDEKGQHRLENLVLSYNNQRLKNFHLLNSETFKKNQHDLTLNENDLSSLEQRLKLALADEDYEQAEILQKKIDQLKD